jgi:hypothetical protein
MRQVDCDVLLEREFAADAAFCVRLVGPRNGDEHRAKNLLASEAPVVRRIGKDRATIS